MKEYKKLIFQALGTRKTGMEIRLIKNKKGREFDIIEVKIKGRDTDLVTFRCSPEEASQISWALNKAIYHFLMGFEPYHKFRMKGGMSKFDKKDIWWSV